MSLRKYRERLRIIDHHIRTKATGNAEILAHKLNLSPIGAYKFLAEMREEGFPVKYSKKENRFYYNPPGKMIGYVFVEYQDNESKEKKARKRKRVKLFSIYNYNRNWAGNFVFSFSQ